MVDLTPYVERLKTLELKGRTDSDRSPESGALCSPVGGIDSEGAGWGLVPASQGEVYLLRFPCSPPS